MAPIAYRLTRGIPTFSRRMLGLGLALAASAIATPARADLFTFSTGSPDGLMATASRPGTTSPFEIETADDFVAPSQISLTSATFTGLLVSSSLPSVTQVIVEIYRVFPQDSTVPPSGNVPTRVNSPSDVAFTTRDSASAGLSFSVTTLTTSFTADNSVRPGGIHPSPGQTTGGDGAVTGTEVVLSVSFLMPIDLPADHYFFVPQVEVSGGDFYWLSAPRPIVAPGTPFLPDLQTWTRDAALDPDWLRIGTDIVGGAPAPTFNAAFSLDGQTIPEPMSVVLLGVGLGALGWLRRRHG